ncbi:hydrolase [Neosynechococcus sphagnicola sy1]|uniref:Hydrolase n=1 Tax=Neosynechococcus sphagnicola sy1 TaxID=1497020 RepID=A0A098TNN9_9CYAN|nr:hydrolase [Neosynechococcus sphagnicola sy1]
MPLPATPPQVIFVDAVGTLFGIQGSVGAIYAAIAAEFGIEASAPALNSAFFASFQSSSAAAFPGVAAAEIPQQEYRWWRAIAAQTFQRVGLLDQISDFEALFTELYHHFATATPWYLYPDVIPTLQSWLAQGIPLGILSNFDSRLYTVLEVLGLRPYFATITISTEVGSAKPQPQVFQVALAKHQCPAAAAWHIGDSLREDYVAAQMAGLRGIWLNRPE